MSLSLMPFELCAPGSVPPWAGSRMIRGGTFSVKTGPWLGGGPAGENGPNCDCGFTIGAAPVALGEDACGGWDCCPPGCARETETASSDAPKAQSAAIRTATIRERFSTSREYQNCGRLRHARTTQNQIAGRGGSGEISGFWSPVDSTGVRTPDPRERSESEDLMGLAPGPGLEPG